MNAKLDGEKYDGYASDTSPIDFPRLPLAARPFTTIDATNKKKFNARGGAFG